MLELPVLKPVLESCDGPAVRVTNGDGASELVLVCEHASHRVPSNLAGHLAPENVILSHAGWDPGAAAVARCLSETFDAPLVTAEFSRLVFDVNRPPASPDAMRTTSEVHDILGNTSLTEAERRARTTAIYEPFHEALDNLLNHRIYQGTSVVLVTIHTFASVFFGEKREVQLGILHDDDSRLADAMLAAAPGLTDLKVARNAPYGPGDGVTHTLRRHALKHGLPNVMIEVRNDLVEASDQRKSVAVLLETLLRNAMARLGPAVHLSMAEGS